MHLRGLRCGGRECSGLRIHIFGKYAVASGRITHKDMRDGTDQPAVLQDRTAAHSLHDAACVFKQRRVRDMDHQISQRIIIAAYLLDFNAVGAGRGSVDRRIHEGFAACDILPESERNSDLLLRQTDHRAEDSAGRIRGKHPDALADIESAEQLAGSACAAGDNIPHGDRDDIA